MLKSYDDELKDIILNSLQKEFDFNSRSIRKNYSPDKIKWRADVYAKKESEEWLVLIKTIPSIPDVYWKLFIESQKIRPELEYS